MKTRNILLILLALALLNVLLSGLAHVFCTAVLSLALLPVAYLMDKQK